MTTSRQSESYAARKARGFSAIQAYVDPKAKAALRLLAEHLGASQAAALSMALMEAIGSRGLTRELNRIESEREEAAAESAAPPRMKGRKTTRKRSRSSE